MRAVFRPVFGGIFARIFGRFADLDEFVEISATSARVFTLPTNVEAIDIDVRGSTENVGDILIQFGDANVGTTFDPILCKYHPRTDGFGVETIGVPPGATHMAVMAVQAGGKTRVRVRAATDWAGYGGPAQEAVFAGNAAYYAVLGTPMAVGTSFTACWEGTFADAVQPEPAAIETCVTLAPTATPGALGSITPQFRMSKSASGHLSTFVQSNAAAADTPTNQTTTLTDGERVLYCAKYNASTKVTQLLRYTMSGGVARITSAASTNGLNTDPLTHVILGARLNTTGPDLFYSGKFRQFYLYEGLLEDSECFAMFGPKAPPMPYCVSDPSNGRSYIRPIGGQLIDLYTNRPLVQLTGSVTVQDTADPDAAFLPTRLRAQSASTVKSIEYGASDTSAANLSCGSADGIHVAHAHTEQDLDIRGSSPTTASSDVTAIVAGVSIVGIGPDEQGVIANASGDADDTGRVNLIGTTYLQPENARSWRPLIGQGGAPGQGLIYIDFEEIYNGGVEWDHRSWRDFNITDPMESHWTIYDSFGSATDPTVDASDPSIWIGFRDPIKGGWLDPSTNGRDILVDTPFVGIGTQVKAWHCGLENDEIVIGGVDHEDGLSNYPINFYIYRITSRDSDGRPSGFTKELVGNIQDYDPNLKRAINPLISQARVADCGSTACCFVASMTCVPDIPQNLTTSGIGYMVTGEGVLRIVTNTNADDRASFRLPRRTPYILTVATTGVHEGKMQLTNWVTHEHIVIETPGLSYVGEGGSFFAFDPQGWVMPDGKLWLVAQTATQKQLYWFRPLGDDPSDGYENYAITDEPPVQTAIGDWRSMSPEPVFVLKNRKTLAEITNDDIDVWMLYTEKDVDDQFTGPSLANKTEIWLSNDRNEHIRVDFQALQGASTDVNICYHESEWWMGEPDPERGGRIANFLDINYVKANPSNPGNVTNQLLVCNPGMWSEPVVEE